MLVMSIPSASFSLYFFFFFNDTATTEIYTLSLHDALPISTSTCIGRRNWAAYWLGWNRAHRWAPCTVGSARSEEHTSELQSHSDLVCRLLLEKKKKKTHYKKIELMKQQDCSNVTEIKSADT